VTANRVLTLKYRPQTFDDVWIQDHVKQTLKRAIGRNRLANAYLFAGPRGVGKTTCARILAKSLNCVTGPTATPCNKCPSCVEITASRSMDVIEIDGASNTGVDNIRELRENVKYAPSSGRFKIYIIDEVHMLSESAFNALLKTLEEPPAHVKFIFATTEAHDLPTTIISRCQRFDFRKATALEIKERLEWLCRQESIKASEAALMAIARRADGALRDSESTLDQMAAFKPDGIELTDVEELLGLVPSELFYDYAQLLAAGDAAGLIAFLDRLFGRGYDHTEFFGGLIQHFRSLLLMEVTGSAAGLSLLPEEANRYSGQAQGFGRQRLLAVVSALADMEQVARHTSLPRVWLEVVSLELAGDGRVAAAPASDQPCGNGRSGTPSRPRSDQSLWAELRLRTNERKPLLAAVLDHAVSTSYTEQVMTISFAATRKELARQANAETAMLGDILSTLVGAPARVRIDLTGGAEPDVTSERIGRVFGHTEEERTG
jgi:DNA polymerase-3 subunit gamma/tau